MRPKANYIDPQQFQDMIQHIPDLKIRKWKDKDVEMLFKICYWCALRIGEGIRLTAEDFDLKRSEVFLGKTKTNKNDYAAIPPQLMPELEEYLSGKTGPLLPGCNYSIAYNWLIRLGKMLDILALTTPESVTGEKTKTHIFRKSIGKDYVFGTYGKKAPMNLVMDKMRHKEWGTTSRYLKIGIEGVKDFESQDQIQVSEESGSWSADGSIDSNETQEATDSSSHD